MVKGTSLPRSVVHFRTSLNLGRDKKRGNFKWQFVGFWDLNYFLNETYSKNLAIDDKSVDCVLRTQTWASRMVDTDESTELWWHPICSITSIGNVFIVTITVLRDDFLPLVYSIPRLGNFWKIFWKYHFLSRTCFGNFLNKLTSFIATSGYTLSYD